MVSRRQILVGLSACTISPTLVFGADKYQGWEQRCPKTVAKIKALSPNSSQEDGDLFIQCWQEFKREGRGPAAVEGPLYVGRFADPMYFLLEPISWKPDDSKSNLPEVAAPKGFVTDFASIPRAFWSLLRPDGIYAYAAVIHDYLYWVQPIKDRAVADEILRECMINFKVEKDVIAEIYAGVRVGGEIAWRDNARRKKRGERRILKKFPEDPTIRWDEWRKQPGVFA